MKVTKKLQKIKSVKFKYPELYNENAEQIILSSYKTLLDAEEKLQQAREAVRNWEERVKICERTFREKTSNVDIEYETVEVDVADPTEHNIRIVNDEDARNAEKR